jgi:glyoxylase-like metal-dependent hydrolase (beta-lactamase superfamily II)
MQFRVGNATITKIPELLLEVLSPTDLMPHEDPERVRQLTSSLSDDDVDHAKGVLRLSVHSWLVRTPERVILVDTGTGNGKVRPTIPVLNQLNEPFIERLEANGISRTDVTDILVTHIHADHVGWNTQLEQGEWRPTFPKARHYFSNREIDYSAALARGDDAKVASILAGAGLGEPLHPPAPGVYEDSVAPIIEAGLATTIEVEGAEPVPGFRYISTPGHSIDHASIMFEHDGERAFFWGDVLHHPLQLVANSWNSGFCEFPNAARSARRKALDLAADTGALIFTTHFPGSSVGRVRRDGDRYVWQAVQGKKS